jgi:dephospho-CoA kinase
MMLFVANNSKLSKNKCNQNKMKKLKVAVTGNIGSGKSSFCKYLEEMNYSVIKADEIAKDLLANDENVKREIIKHFGYEAYQGKEINKKFLADKIFSNQTNLNKINSIIHPPVIKKVIDLMNDKLQTSDVVFHEAALIYEADIEHLFDIVVLIAADSKIRMERKKLHDNFSEEEFLKRELNQIPEEEKKKRADFVFTNDGTLEELKTKAELFIKILRGLAKQ